MPFDGITIRALCRELNSDLLDSRIDKVHQPEKDEIVLSTRGLRTGSLKLLISVNARWARMHISNEKKKNPARPPAFCMLLRKYLEGGKIKEIKQVDFERIVHIRIEALDDFRDWKDKLLICEFMGRHSNIILLDPESNLIIDAIKKYGSNLSSYREVLPGKTYISPPDQQKLNPLNSDFDEFVRFLWNQGEDKNLASAIFNVYSGISPFSAKEICRATGIESETPAHECGDYELSKIYDYINKLLKNINGGSLEAVVCYDNKQAWDFAPYPLSIFSESTICKSYPSINAACDRFYQDKLKLIRLESMRNNLNRKLKGYLDKAYKKQFHQESDRVKALENDKYRIWGELLTAYAHQYSKGDTEVVLDDFYSGDKISLQLDPRYTPIQNAQRYFKIYNKSRKALLHLENLMAKNQEEIDYLESVMLSIQLAENPAEIQDIAEELEKEGYSRGISHKAKSGKIQFSPRKFLSSDGIEILAGRNNRQNDILTLKEAKKTDLWLHSKDIPGTHVIVRLSGSINSIDELPDSTLEEAATLAAYFSKARQSEKVPVDYTYRSNVRKPAGAKPGIVIYDKYWTIIARPNPDYLDRLLNSEIKPE
jgi:predicted ribosome quality control (RQC) complex YloA/Tae2 family protein